MLRGGRTNSTMFTEGFLALGGVKSRIAEAGDGVKATNTDLVRMMMTAL